MRIYDCATPDIGNITPHTPGQNAQPQRRMALRGTIVTTSAKTTCQLEHARVHAHAMKRARC
eukprot:11180371-Lingulodinium_polyedra.AAC.1